MYYNEGNEPSHVHVVHEGNQAKFWLGPPVQLCSNHGYNSAELRRIKQTLEERLDFFKDQWRATQAKKK
jgi:hypothetical protein